MLKIGYSYCFFNAFLSFWLFWRKCHKNAMGNLHTNLRQPASHRTMPAGKKKHICTTELWVVEWGRLDKEAFAGVGSWGREKKQRRLRRNNCLIKNLCPQQLDDKSPCSNRVFPRQLYQSRTCMKFKFWNFCAQSTWYGPSSLCAAYLCLSIHSKCFFFLNKC